MLYDLIDISIWKTKKEILKELKLNGVFMNERIFRKTVEKHNKLYFEHLADYYIAHSSKGYKATKDEEEIRNTAVDFRKRGINQIVKYSKTMKALGENNNLKLEINNDKLIFLEQ